MPQRPYIMSKKREIHSSVNTPPPPANAHRVHGCKFREQSVDQMPIITP